MAFTPYNGTDASTFTPYSPFSRDNSSNSTDSLTSSGVGSLPVIKQATQLGIGIGTGVVKAGLNVGKAFVKGSQAISNGLQDVFGGSGADYTPVVNGIDTISNT